MLRFTTLSDDVSCFECGRPVPYESLEDHMIGSHAYTRCPQCNLLFNLYRLEEHIKRYHDKHEKNYTDETFKCAYCDEKVSFSDFGRHLLAEHNYRECPVCRLLCNEKDLESHMNISHKLIKCQICWEYSKNHEDHLSHKHGKITCHECDTLVSTHEFSHHLKYVHAYTLCEVCSKPIKPSGKNNHMQAHDMAPCPVCFEFFLNNRLELHLSDSHNKRICPKCNALIEIQSFDEHNKTKHFYIECEVCGALESPIKMDLHLRDCHGYKPCPKCGIVIEPRKLNNHIKNSH